MNPIHFHIFCAATVRAGFLSLFAILGSGALEIRQSPITNLPEDVELPRRSTLRSPHGFVTLVSAATSRRNIKGPTENAENASMGLRKRVRNDTEGNLSGVGHGSRKKTSPAGRSSSVRPTAKSEDFKERQNPTSSVVAAEPLTNQSTGVLSAPLGYAWVIRESSDPRRAPLLSQYTPKAKDTYVDLNGSPWKLVHSSWLGAHLVVEMMDIVQWNRELVATLGLGQAKLASLHRPARRFRKKRHRTAAKSSNTTQHSRLYLHVSQWLSSASNASSAVGRRFGSTLLKSGATVADMGLVTAQAWGLTIMLGLLLVLLVIDRGSQWCGTDCSDDEDNLENGPYSEGRMFSKNSPHLRHLTSWEVIPGVEYMEPPSDFHLG